MLAAADGARLPAAAADRATPQIPGASGNGREADFAQRCKPFAREICRATDAVRAGVAHCLEMHKANVTGR